MAKTCRDRHERDSFRDLPGEPSPTLHLTTDGAGLHLEKGREQFVDRMVQKAIEAVEEDGAHVTVLGCTGLAGLDEQVKAGLR